MQFLGLLVMKNLVNPESAEVITTLRLAHLRTVMVTGMNSISLFCLCNPNIIRLLEISVMAIEDRSVQDFFPPRRVSAGVVTLY